MGFIPRTKRAASLLQADARLLVQLDKAKHNGCGSEDVDISVVVVDVVDVVDVVFLFFTTSQGLASNPNRAIISISITTTTTTMKTTTSPSTTTCNWLEDALQGCYPCDDQLGR